VAINNWFIKKRGRAIAIARVGGNFSNFIMVPACVFVIAHAGWRVMYAVFAIAAWVTVLIPSAVLMRRRPEDMGLLPDGEQVAPYHSGESHSGSQVTPNTTYSHAPEPVWNRREVIASGTFWLITIAFAINSMSFQGINISLAPYIQDLGYSDTMLAVLITFRAVVMMPAGLIMGFLAEKAEKTSMRAVPFLVLSLATLLFCFAKQPVNLWLAITAYGLGAAGVHVTQEVLWANYYGRLSLGLVRSLAFFFSFGLGSIGPIAMNLVFDTVGSYRPAFVMISLLFMLAAIFVASARPVKAKRYSNARNT
jgi:cyanate permease